jgi:hypothetical protein
MPDRAVPSEGLRVGTLEDEVAPYRRMSPEEKLALLRVAVRTGMRLLALNPKRDEILAHRDPPHETTAALLRGHRP